MLKYFFNTQLAWTVQPYVLWVKVKALVEPLQCNLVDLI